MTTNQTIDGVPREAFKWALEQLEEDGNKGCGYFDSLRALLDAPACEFHQSADECETYSGKHPCSPAAQPQGDPVAWIKPDVAATLRKDDCCYAFGSQNPKGSLIPLYAEQPAPVAVVMPEPATTQEFGDESMANGWNACLDELKRLNGGAK
jgi:hypothetical protein